MKKFPKPEAGEYIPYTIEYIDMVPDDGLVLDHLQNNLQLVKELVGPLSEEKLTTPCAEGEWTIKDILVHVIDTERVFAYRAMRFARNDTTALPGYEQNDYVAHAGANERSLEDILEEYVAVRMATIALFNSFTEAVMTSSGLANNHTLTVRAAIYITVGHELHHINSIKENYLS